MKRIPFARFGPQPALLGLAMVAACAPRTTSSEPAPMPPPAAPVPAAPAPASPTVPAAPIATVGAGLPRQRAPQPTGAAISADDLMSRVYVIADDSLEGRRAGTRGNLRMTDHLAAEARRIGLEPAGTNGSFFQAIPLVRTGVDPNSALEVDGAALRLFNDFLPLPPEAGVPGLGTTLRAQAVEAVFGGTLGGPRSPLTAEQARGKLVVLVAPSARPTERDTAFWAQAGLNRFPTAAAIAIATLELLPPQITEFVREGGGALDRGAEQGRPGPLALVVSRATATRLLGAEPATLRPGARGRTVRANVSIGRHPTEAPARNVVAVLRGSDPVLRNQYVAIGAHNDHVGIQARALDHDSVRAYNQVTRPEGAEDEPRPATAEETTRIRAVLDSLRRAHGAPRRDSVANGADDDASGSAGMLEIAQALAALEPRPRRSILFVWHTAEELGLFGSEFFTANPTVPRDSIVAQLNIDMIGRGRDEDIAGAAGGANYLQLVGSRRLSPELGDLVESVNATRNHGFRFDYQYDAPNHPQQIYCRSDHVNYARFGIPIVFFTTGVHRDYHQVTDEPQYIDYAKLTSVSSFIRDVAVAVANLDHRPRVDKPRPDPAAPCRQ